MKVIICFSAITALALGQPAPQVAADAAMAAAAAQAAQAKKAFTDIDRLKFERFGDFDKFSQFGKLAELEMLAQKGKFEFDHSKFEKLATMDLLAMPKIAGVEGLQFAFQGRGKGGDEGERQYDRGKRSLDRKQWDEAVAQFTEAAAASKTNADGAMYWKAYALMKLGRGKEATAVLDELAKNHPQSRWLNDAKAMRVEIAQAAGRPVSPENASDDEIKLMAINGLMQSDPERSIPLLEKILTSQSSVQLRERALFVLSQSNSPKAREIVVRIAKGGANPDLQAQAIRTLGVQGGKENRQMLADVYASSNDLAVKKQILNSFMVSGERDRMLAIAKSDPAPELRSSAIRYLGTMGASSQLATMYGSEASPELRAQIMQALFTSGNSQKLIEIAKTEKDANLRNRAINHLGTMGSNSTGAALVEIYAANSDVETRKRVLNALFVQGNAKQIVEVARKETDPDLRRAAVQHLSHMRSKEATDFLMELLNK